MASVPKPDLVRDLGTTSRSGAVDAIGSEPEVIIECTGVGQGIAIGLRAVASGGVVCLTGLGSGGASMGRVADMAAEMVLKNNVVLSRVNADRRHWYRAAEALARADRAWLSRQITRREPPERFRQALQRQQDDSKVVI